MSLFVLQFVTIFILVIFTARANCDNETEYSTDLSHLISENDGDIKTVDLAEGTYDRTFPRPTKPPTIINPTPKPTVVPPVETSKPPTVIGRPPLSSSQKPVVLPPIVTVIPGNRVPVCGRKGRCYQWFDDEIEAAAVADGYQRCSAVQELLAKRYCCIP